MILELKGTKVTIVDKTLGYQGDNLVNTIQVTVDKDSTWNYKLDMYKGKSKCFDSVLMVREGNICTVQLTNEILSYGGRYVFQLRGYTETQTYHSDIFESWVNTSIEYQYDCKQGDCECDCKLPTEFYQVEDNVTEINNHPPYPGDNNKWMIWDVGKHEYVESDIEVIAGGEDYQTKDNLTTSITAESTDEQYPSAKATYDAIQNVNKMLLVDLKSNMTADKTYSEIQTAVFNGKAVIVRYTTSVGYEYYILESFDYINQELYFMNISGDTHKVLRCSQSNYWSITSAQFESKSYKVTALSASSSNEQYPSAKAVYDAIQNASVVTVKITGSGTDSDPYMSSMTYDEIYSAMKADKTVVGVKPSSNPAFFIACISFSGLITFTRLAVLNIMNDDVICESYTIFKDGHITHKNSRLEETANKVTSLSADSTDRQYPSAKAVYDAITAAKPEIVTPSAASTDTQAASAKAVWDMLGDVKTLIDRM